MSAEFKITGTSAGAVKAIEDLNKALDAVGATSERTAKQTKQAEEAAKRFAAQADPTERYRQQMEKLAQAVQHGGLEYGKASTLAEKYGNALERASKAGDKTFGGEALQNISKMAMGLMGVSSALDLVVSAFRAANEEQQRAADNAMRARLGVGQLSQLAASATDASGKITPASQEAAMKDLVAETDRYLAMGAAEDRNAAASLTFDLNSAGLSPADREFAAKLRAKGVLQDVAGLGQAYDAARTALGVEEVGTFEQFSSKAIAAGSVSPGTIQALPLALSKAGADAKKLGMSDEFLFSAGAVLAKESGSPDEGGTKMAALLAAMNKSGVDMTGMTGQQMIQRLSQENVGYGGVFKDNREAVNAFATIRDNLRAVRYLEANVTSAQSQGLAAQSLGLPGVDLPTAAANVEAAEQGEYDLSLDKLDAERESLVNAVQIASRRRDKELGRFAIQRWFNRGADATFDFLGADEFILRGAQNIEAKDPGSFKPETLQRIEAYLERQNQLMERDAQRQQSRVTTQQE